MSDERAALLRAVLEDPSDDLPRLALADFLEEIAASEVDRCRAEMIHLQIALASGEQLIAERKRLQAIFRRFIGCAKIEPDGSVVCRGKEGKDVWRRGFVEEIELKESFFLAGMWAGKFFREHPVLKVVLTGKKPRRAASTFSQEAPNRLWDRWDWHDAIPYYALSPEVFILLECCNKGCATVEYADDTAALTGLSSACVEFGRLAAGLPPLRTEGLKILAAGHADNNARGVPVSLCARGAMNAEPRIPRL